MNESNASATIIPFPTPVPARPSPVVQPVGHADSDPQASDQQTLAENPAQRLRNALDLLESALAEQRVAVANWRGAMAELSGSVGGLGQSLRSYQQALDQLKGRITP